MCFGQKAPLHLSLSHSGEQEEEWGWGRWREYLSSLLRFVRASGISKLLLYTDLLQRDRRESRQSVSLASAQIRLPSRLPQRCRGCGSPLNTPLCAVFEIFLWFSPPSAPLSVLRHVDGPPGWDGRAPVRDAQHLHGLPLRSPFAVTVQHGGVHPLPGRICGRARGTREEVIRLTRPASAGYCICILRHKFRTL